VYLPKCFEADDATALELLEGLSAADLVTATPDGPFVTFLPLVHEPADGGFGSLVGHVARKNDHWRVPALGESVVIVHGQDSYITPSWYPSKQTHGRVVPTWHYLTAHIYGELVIHDDAVWLGRVVRRLTDKYEAARDAPWSVDDAPSQYTDAQLNRIVGVELRITRIEAKAKLGQDETAEDIGGVVEGLAARGDAQFASATARARQR
jgi:transcriptional regulator